MSTLILQGSAPLRGSLRAAGDKSSSHRALMFAALSTGEARIHGANPGQDVRSTFDALRRLGIRARREGADFVVHGGGLRWRPATDAIDCGNSGTTCRLLAGILAAQPFTTTLDGDASLRVRPMGRIARPLRKLGARVEGPTNGDRLPLVITGDALRPTNFALQVASAQVKSCLLLAGLAGGVEVSVEEPASSRDHTERWLEALGADIEFGPGFARIRPSTLSPVGEVSLGADPSAALLYAAATAVVPGSEVRLLDVLDNPTRNAAFAVLERMGVRVNRENPRRSGGEKIADLLVTAPDTLEATEVLESEMPRLLDEVPALAAVAAFASGTTIFHGVDELRVKESDRVTESVALADAHGIRAVDDGSRLRIEGGDPRVVAEHPHHDDHRMAMSAVITSLGALHRHGGRASVDLSSAAVSDPDFATNLERLRLVR